MMILLSDHELINFFKACAPTREYNTMLERDGKMAATLPALVPTPSEATMSVWTGKILIHL